MRWFFFLLTLPVCGSNFTAEPQKIKQGEVIRVMAGPEITSARMNGKTIPLFAQPDGSHTGLMPVRVMTKAGTYTLEYLDAKGVPSGKLPITVIDARYHRENVSIAPATAALAPSPGEQKKVGDFQRVVSDTRYWKEPFLAPVPGCVTSPFGSLRMLNGKLTGSFHAGVDQRGAQKVMTSRCFVIFT